MKVAILIPSTSSGRGWRFVTQSYLYNTLGSLKTTVDPEFEYTVYVGYDHDDPFYTRDLIQKGLEAVGLPIVFVPLFVERGHVTKMWNILAKMAYDDGADYFYQCGDDILFDTPGWVGASIRALQNRDNIGMTGPRNKGGNTRILTQSFVHRTHLDIFGHYFPEEIRNWFCDDWINDIYEPNRLDSHYTCDNIGGEPRYDIVLAGQFACNALVERDKVRVFRYKPILFGKNGSGVSQGNE
jgi:hypothetical protein